MTTILVQQPEGANAHSTSREADPAVRMFEYREVTEVGEIEASLRLRHRVYADADDLRWYLDPDSPPMLLDAYDRFSRIFGLFERTPGKSLLVGTLRVVLQEPGPARMALEIVAQGHPRLVERLRAHRRESFPFIALSAEPEAARAAVTRAVLRGEVVAEAGRFALDPDFRAGGIVGPGLARFMIESALAPLMLPGGGDRAFVTSSRSGAAALYGRMGFRLANGFPRGFTPGHSEPLLCLEIDRECLPTPVRERAMVLAAELTATGRTTLVVGGVDPTAGGHPWPSTRRIPTPSPIPNIALRVAGLD